MNLTGVVLGPPKQTNNGRPKRSGNQIARNTGTISAAQYSNKYLLPVLLNPFAFFGPFIAEKI